MTTDVDAPSEPASIVSFGFQHDRRRERPAPTTGWLWRHFEVTTVEREWIVNKTGKRRLTDRDIRCVYVDEITGIRCNWKTADSARQTATANMKGHLARHGIHPPSATATPTPSTNRQSSTVSLFQAGEPDRPAAPGEEYPSLGCNVEATLYRHSR
jgi:hypothetical protein